MNHAPVTCPECGTSRVINGRGACKCGAYMIVATRKSFTATRPARTWFWRAHDAKWITFDEHKQSMR